MNELFIIFRNKVLLKLIFSYVNHIHTDILEEKVVKWHKLLNNINLLGYYNYLNEIKQHHNNRINKDLFKNNTLIEYITRGDSLDVLKYFIKQQPHLLTFNAQTHNYEQHRSIKYDLLFYSVKYNSLKIFYYLESFTNVNNKKRKTSSSSLSTINKIKWDYYLAISIVPLSGNFELFIYLLDKVDIQSTILNIENNINEYSNIIELIINSAGYGRSEMLDHIYGLFENDKKCLLDDILINHSPTIFDKLIINGHLFIVKQYFNNNNISVQCKLQNIDLLTYCAQNNQFEMMKYFHENQLGSTKYFRLVDHAISNGNLEMIKWLHHNLTAIFTKKAMDNAAKNGNLEIIKWLHENRTEGCTIQAMESAAWYCHFEILKWLHENRTECSTTNAMEYAAKNGHYEIVKLLHHNRSQTD